MAITRIEEIWINFVREKHIIMVRLPPHRTHRMQPLNIAFTRLFKVFYNQEIDTWISRNVGKILTSQYEVTELMVKAYIRAATMGIELLIGFCAKGIYSCGGIYP